MRASVGCCAESPMSAVAADGRVGHVRDAELAAAVDEPAVEVAPVEHVAAILHGRDRRQAQGFVELARVDVR